MKYWYWIVEEVENADGDEHIVGVNRFLIRTSQIHRD
jgi:hypothetical protein